MKKTMRDVLKALVLEMGEQEGKEIFEWYCKTYNLAVYDKAPSVILHEVFGL